ncbi:hypothetical protein EZS27_008670 [termite gut metagenome]|uniref:Uncharacterized protein n=1 Tax=termite gut metagenome TaxID=433724 RepID=A0A5J4SE20_9ZZZZ
MSITNNIYQPTLFITEELFKLNSPISANMEIVEFIPFISFAQDLYIIPILGTPLSDELKQQIEEDEVSEANAELIIKLSKGLSFYSVYCAAPFLWSSFLSKGITIRNSENSTSINNNDLAYIRNILKSDAEAFNNQFINFLCEKRNDYPLWRPSHPYLCKQCKEDSGDNIKHYDSGIYMKKKLLS